MSDKEENSSALEKTITHQTSNESNRVLRPTSQVSFASDWQFGDIIVNNLSFTVKSKVPEENSAPLESPKSPKTEGFQSKLAENEKVIIHPMSTVVKRGRLTAILGMSGAGKTTLLELLAQECRLKGTLSGEVYLSEQPNVSIKRASAFVQQDYSVLVSMTVREALEMSATLRMSVKATNKQRTDAVEGLIDLLHLQSCQDIAFGGNFIKGISGGEKKRTCVAVELVSDPLVLFLDEPTTGLDPFTAYVVVKQLKDVAHLTGRIVLMSIHQPSTEIFDLIDDILILSNGHLVYDGARSEMVQFMESRGFKCPKYTNPADFVFMEVLSHPEAARMIADDRSDDGSESEETRERYPIAVARRPSPNRGFWIQWTCLTRNHTNRIIRDPSYVVLLLASTIIVALLIALVFVNTSNKTTIEQLRAFPGAINFLALYELIASIIASMNIVYDHREVYYREYQAGFYNIPAYFLSTSFIYSAIQGSMAYLRILIAYYIIGFTPAFSSLLFTGVVLMFMALTGVYVGLFFSSVFPDMSTAMSAVPIFILPMTLYGGTFTKPSSITPWLAWIRYCSPVYWANLTISQIQFKDGIGNCNPLLFPCDGTLILKFLGLYNGLPVGVNFVFCVAWTIFYFGLAYVGLAVVTHRRSKQHIIYK